MLPKVVNQLDNAKLGLATYGICWEPDRNLRTLEAVAKAYAESIASLAGSTPCFLLGWCYGGIIASKTALYLPKDSTHLILLDVLHLSLMERFYHRRLQIRATLLGYVVIQWCVLGLHGHFLQQSLKASCGWTRPTKFGSICSE